MHYFRRVLILFTVVACAGCDAGVRDLDFLNKEFQVTYNLDSTRTLDSTQLVMFRNAKAVYSFSQDGKGTSHILMGMLSRDVPFTWKFENDSLSIDQAIYFVRRQDKGFVLVNDSVKLILSKQPGG